MCQRRQLVPGTAPSYNLQQNMYTHLLRESFLLYSLRTLLSEFRGPLCEKHTPMYILIHKPSLFEGSPCNITDTRRTYTDWGSWSYHRRQGWVWQWCVEGPWRRAAPPCCCPWSRPQYISSQPVGGNSTTHHHAPSASGRGLTMQCCLRVQNQEYGFPVL